MIGREDQWRGLWFDAHQLLQVYLEPVVDTDEARALASRSCAYWLQAAGDALQTTAGPYAALLELARHELTQRHVLPPEGSAVKFELPVLPTASTLPYSLAYGYCDFRRMVLLCGWDKRMVHRMSKALALTWPVTREGWARLVVNASTDLAVATARRAFDVRARHTCTGCVICEEFGARWEKEDQLTSDWLTSQRIGRDG